MRTLQNPGTLEKLLGKDRFISQLRKSRGKPPLTPEQRTKFAADRKLRLEGGDNPNRFQQAVRNRRRKGESFGQSAGRLGADADTFGGS